MNWTIDYIHDVTTQWMLKCTTYRISCRSCRVGCSFAATRCYPPLVFTPAICCLFPCCGSLAGNSLVIADRRHYHHPASIPTCSYFYWFEYRFRTCHVHCLAAAHCLIQWCGSCRLGAACCLGRRLLVGVKELILARVDPTSNYWAVWYFVRYSSEKTGRCQIDEWIIKSCEDVSNKVKEDLCLFESRNDVDVTLT